MRNVGDLGGMDETMKHSGWTAQLCPFLDFHSATLVT